MSDAKDAPGNAGIIRKHTNTINHPVFVLIPYPLYLWSNDLTSSG
jgi:hypothetical protein